MKLVLTPAEQRRQRIAAYIIFAIAGVLIVFGFSFFGEASGSVTWPVAEGTVNNVTIEVDYSNSQSGASSSRPWYYYKVTYGYEVNGFSYTGTRYSLGGGNRASKLYQDSGEAREAANEAYPRGSAVDVYYDPANPSSTVLSPGVNLGTLWPLLIGIPFLAAGVYLLRTARPSASEE